jgi:DNA uptake protein ComE-like DNA-binding protein
MIRFATTLLLAALGMGATGCLVDAQESEDVSASTMGLTSEETAILLAFVNDPATTVGVLDVDVDLDSRAANNIVAHRDGLDGVAGSADDDLFGTIYELDGVPYVGETALQNIRDYALAHAPPPPPEVVEGIAFTSEQVAAVIWGVNKATLAELDYDAALERRAAENLFAGKPYTSIGEMGPLAYVGPTALTALRDHAAAWSAEKSAGLPTDEPVVDEPVAGQPQAGTYDGVVFDEATAQAALAIALTYSYTELVAAGLPGTGAAPIVGNRPYTALSQVAAVSGVGPATMTALHAHAASTLTP